MTTSAHFLAIAQTAPLSEARADLLQAFRDAMMEAERRHSTAEFREIVEAMKKAEAALSERQRWRPSLAVLIPRAA